MADASFVRSEPGTLTAAISTEIEDDSYIGLVKYVQAAGSDRGRRPRLPVLESTNLTFLQLMRLKEKCSVSWKVITMTTEKIFANARFHCISNLVMKISKEFNQIDLNSDEKRRTFYTTPVDLDYCGPFLAELGIGLGHLNNVVDISVVSASLKQGAIIDLVKMGKSLGNSESDVVLWMEAILGQQFLGKQSREVSKAVKKLFKEYNKLLKNRHRAPELLQNFMTSTFDFPTADQDIQDSAPEVDQEIQDSAPEVELTHSVALIHSESDRVMTELIDSENENEAVTDSDTDSGRVRSLGKKLAEKGMQLKELRIELENIEKEKKELKESCAVLTEEIRNKNTTAASLNQRLVQEKNNAEKLRCELSVLKKQLSDSQNELSDSKGKCAQISQSAYYKRLKRREAELDSDFDVVLKHKECDKVIAALKRQVKSLQTVVSNKRIVAQLIQDELVKTVAEKEDLEKKLNPKLKDGFAYSDNVVKTFIELIGEAEVPAGRCSKVVKVVAQHIFNVHYSDSDLPSERSALRYADRGQVLSKYQVAEKMASSDGYDLHADGTSKDHNKFVGHQVNLSTGETMSVGFTPVFTEDTSTLLGIAINMLEELADVCECDGTDTKERFQGLLKKLVSTMGDRASVMKSYSKALNEKRKEILATDDQLEFLHCNAHFLLGMSTACDKVFEDIVKKVGRVGRDKLAVFKSWGTKESAASRYIRTACDCFGPRGDEKNGCRDAWIAYCVMNDKTSHVSSFRSNRFNNYFQGAACLYFHREDIIHFLNLKEKNNLKLQSVLADAESEVVTTFVQALGILYCKVTYPYWHLIQSDTHYLDFYKYVVAMHTSLKAWSTDAAPLLVEDAASLFEDFPTNVDDPTYRHLFKDLSNMTLQETLQQLCSALVIVTERQLCDFLPEGRYHCVEDDARRAKMQHCKLTNLFGEACFGDLGFSMFKRRNATLHHHSTVNMLKRNRTISTWFSLKSKDEQASLLRLSAKKGKDLRVKHKAVEECVLNEAKKKLNLCKEQKAEKERAALEKKRGLTERVKHHGGPCLQPRDVDKLLKGVKLKKDRVALLKTEIEFQKFVIGGEKAKKLRTSVPLDQLVQNLKTYLGEDTGTTPTEAAESTQPGNLPVNPDNLDSDDEELLYDRQIDRYDSDAESEDDPQTNSETETETSAEDDSESEDAITENMEKSIQDFRFNNQGEMVAVFYQMQRGEDFFIGQVVNVKSPDVAVVTFLQQCGIKDTLFRYPDSPDIEDVDRKFVFSWNIDITSTNGRIWSVDKNLMKDLHKKFRWYLKKYCN